MKKWQYAAIGASLGRQDLVTELNTWGKDGWKVIAVVNYDTEDGYVLMMKEGEGIGVDDQE